MAIVTDNGAFVTDNGEYVTLGGLPVVTDPDAGQDVTIPQGYNSLQVMTALGSFNDRLYQGNAKIIESTIPQDRFKRRTPKK